MSLDTIISHCRDRMDKSVQYLDNELRGLRTGRATTALIDYLRVDYYGSPTELRELAGISVPEPTQLLVKPFDPGSKNEIVRTLETAELGLNPQVDGNSIRINVPPPSGDRRKQLVAQVRKIAEEAKVAVRNERRDANKQVDQSVKDKTNTISEDAGKGAKSDIDELTKTHIELIDQHANKKVKEIEEV
ncbi:MAG: ribosome recycling factor [Planctomycetota bacterium]|jgi:ribosome recycling factor